MSSSPCVECAYTYIDKKTFHDSNQVEKESMVDILLDLVIGASLVIMEAILPS